MEFEDLVILDEEIHLPFASIKWKGDDHGFCKRKVSAHYCNMSIIITDTSLRVCLQAQQDLSSC